MQLTNTWEAEEQFDRKYQLEDEDGDVIETFEDYPTLNQLRTAEQKHGERINLTNIGVPCANCSKEIQERFGADPRGNLLCWECAVTEESDVDAGIRVNTDPTSATLSESHLHEKSLCDYVINVATGCRHGCKFCYVPTTPGYEARDEMLEEQANVEDIQEEWGSYLLYRDDLPERLHEELNRGNPTDSKYTDRGRGAVMLSSGTDCYQDRRAAQITRGVVHELASNEIPVRILTRSSIAVQDSDLFNRWSDRVTVGSSIPSFNQELVKTIEPGAPPPLTRWQMLDMLQKEGIPVFVSMSPTYPTLDEQRLFQLLTRFKALRPEVIFHEPINPRGSNFDMLVETLRDAGLEEEAQEFESLKDPQNWAEYALKHLNTVQKKAEELDAPPVHSWPDRELVRATKGKLRDQLAAMRQAISPETFAGSGQIELPESQSPLFDEFEEVRDLVEYSSL